MGKINNVITIPASLKDSFFKYWFEFLRPFHKLTDREIEVIASFVKYRYELSKVITDQDLLDRVTMSDDTRKKVKEDCNISNTYLQVIMTKFKKTKIIEDGKINPKFIPRIDPDSNSFQLLLSFNLK